MKLDKIENETERRWFEFKSKSSRMASKHKFHFGETVDADNDADAIYENVDELKTAIKPSDDVESDFRRRRRRRQNSRGSSSAEDSSGSFSVNDAEKPPKTPAKLRISKPESNRDSSGSAKNSYDDVTINFGKPVIVRANPLTQKSVAAEDDGDDIFGSVSFQSPIQDLTSEEKEILFSLALQRPPIPAPRPSKMSPKLGHVSERVSPQPQPAAEPDHEAESQIYEDPEDLKSSVGSTAPTSFPAPQVPPRNTSALENSMKSSTLKTIHSYENVYCELQPQPKSVENIIDRRLDPNDDVDDDDFPAKFGARPRSKR